MKAGFIYVLTHPSNPNLFKVGVTTRDPEQRLIEHNRRYEKYAGQVVHTTGQKWELKEFHAVPDIYWAESVFWGKTPFADIPYRYGVEVESMNWDQLQRGLDTAKKAGIRPQPSPLPDHVYANTASIRKRLESRGITLLSHVKSIASGKANFRCSNGHTWRTTPKDVGDGQGCPECGVGKSDPEEIRQRINAGVVYLLTHPDKPGFVRVGLDNAPNNVAYTERLSDGWEIHRYRNVEDVGLAESLVWELLGNPLPHDREPIPKALDEAEEAFRKLIYKMREVIALAEKAREVAQGPTSANLPDSTR